LPEEDIVTMIEQRIFRQYDIRGVWGEDFTLEAVKAIGKAYAYYLREALGEGSITVSIGGDARESSPEISAALSEVLNASGINVIDIGMCTTPLQYFSLYHLDIQGGIMITGSHNPSEYNGMKLSVGKETIFGDKIQEIKELILSGKTVSGQGTKERKDLKGEYIDYLVTKFSSLEGIKVVVDAGNGTGGLTGPETMRRLGAEVVELYCEPDGRFPNHHPDPVVLDNLKALIAKVKETGAHAGLGYDGDADRIGVVDGEGNVIWGDKLMIIFSRDILKENPGATIIGEVKCSQTLYDDIEKFGGNPVMWMTGHSLIKKKMKESGALLAGEMSGHIFFADRYFGYDDAVYASLRLMEIIRKSGEPYSVGRLLEGVPDLVSTPEIRVDCPDEVKFKVAEKMKLAFKDRYPVIDIDGVRVNFPMGWGLIRASNTQPALVMRFEATDETELKKIRTEIETELNKII
jgi:phosphomannomutase/phosphoglucomutase